MNLKCTVGLLFLKHVPGITRCLTSCLAAAKHCMASEQWGAFSGLPGCVCVYICGSGMTWVRVPTWRQVCLSCLYFSVWPSVASPPAHLGSVQLGPQRTLCVHWHPTLTYHWPLWVKASLIFTASLTNRQLNVFLYLVWSFLDSWCLNLRIQ